jgi:hypothetical protein
MQQESSSSAFELDVSDPGVLYVRWKRQATEAESRSLMAEIGKQWERRKRYTVVMETHPAVNADARHRSLWGQWHEQNRKQLDAYCVGVAITLDSPLMRGLMTAMSWFAKDPYPMKYVSDVAVARAWARERIAQVETLPQPRV